MTSEVTAEEPFLVQVARDVIKHLREYTFERKVYFDTDDSESDYQVSEVSPTAIHHHCQVCLVSAAFVSMARLVPEIGTSFVEKNQDEYWHRVDGTDIVRHVRDRIDPREMGVLESVFEYNLWSRGADGFTLRNLRQHESSQDDLDTDARCTKALHDGMSFKTRGASLPFVVRYVFEEVICGNGKYLPDDRRRELAIHAADAFSEKELNLIAYDLHDFYGEIEKRLAEKGVLRQ